MNENCCDNRPRALRVSRIGTDGSCFWLDRRPYAGSGRFLVAFGRLSGICPRMPTFWAQTSGRIHVAAYEASREPASRYIGDDTTSFGSLAKRNLTHAESRHGQMRQRESLLPQNCLVKARMAVDG